MLRVSLIDGYVDEPTCLGVPPYISPYPRYIAGAVWNHEEKTNVFYMTIDQIRNNKSLLDVLVSSDLIIVVAGMSVPGRYLSGFPASPNELIFFLQTVSKPLKVLCGPAAKYGFGLSGGKKPRGTSFVKNVFDLIVEGDSEIVISELLKNKLDVRKVNSSTCRTCAGVIRHFAIKGSRLVCQHPFYPFYLICEIETYRGCSRSVVGGCSFCIEPTKGPPDFRPVEDIVDEIMALYKAGVRHFRLGNQPCIFSYMAEDAGESEFPRPNPDALEKLFRGIRSVAPDLKTLHIDNANPGVLAHYPKESRRITKTIVKYHTSGDVAAFGVESVDPNVIKKNNLKATADEIMSAIKLVNKIGSKIGNNGMPELLPGLNFVFGLRGETKNTYRLNYEFLKKVLNEGFLLRRINLRQVIPIPGTRMYNIGNKIISRHKHDFQHFKRMVQRDVERPMLERMLPNGSVLRDVITETYRGKTTFGRQIGSYPLLVGIHGVFPVHSFFDVKIIDHGYRSITAVPYPLNINTATKETIQSLPGIGLKRATRILANRPYTDKKDFLNSFDDIVVGNKILEYVSF